MKIFLDANILVSVLNKEYPLFSSTSRLLSLADDYRYSLFTSPVCMAIAFYFAEKKSGTQLAKRKMELLASKLEITEIGKNEVLKSLGNSKIHDFEDGIEYYAAKSASCKYIVTEDYNDFYFSEIPVIRASAFLSEVVLK